MLKEIKTLKEHNVSSKDIVINTFCLSNTQVDKIDKYITEIANYNTHTNIVGRSTLVDPWKSHILDCVQISKYLGGHQSSILDMGTGAGMPGLVLSVLNFKNVSVVDSSLKKIKFIKYVCKKIKVQPKVYHQRIEKIANTRFDFLVSRALARINNLFFYSHNLLKKNTSLILLKGKKFEDEIYEANKFWRFNYNVYQSLSDKRGKIVVVKDLERAND